MVATPVSLPKPSTIAEHPVPSLLEEDYDASRIPLECRDALPDGMEQIDGNYVEKTGMTAKHGIAQVKLAVAWTNYKISAQQGGEVLAETVCNTTTQKRRPDVAYATDAFVQNHGKPGAYPVTFPLVGEIASPDDSAEDLFQKAREYLTSGAEEVWILLPESRMAFIVVADQVLAFVEGQTIGTQRILPGFSIALDELLA
jgi:Uma2 family endonuclease